MEPCPCSRSTGLRRCKASLYCQLHINLFAVSLLYLPLAIIFSTPISSLYLFVTSQPNSNVTETNGLGQSDAFYSWVVTARGIGLLFAAFVTIWLPFLLCFRVSILLAMVFPIISSLLYANSTEGWMIMLAYFLQGITFGLVEVFIVSYISVTSTMVHEHRKKVAKSEPEVNHNSWRKSTVTVKDKYLAATLIYRTIGWPFGLGISSVMAQFEYTVDQFRWPGWANAVTIAVFFIIFITLFREVDTSKVTASNICARIKNSVSMEKSCRKIQINRPKIKKIIVYAFLAYSGYVTASLGKVTDTIVPPILSDHFGFNITFVSYFSLGIMLTSFIAGIILVFLKCVRVNNRKLFIVVLVAGIIGSTLASDWQAIGHDPCPLDSDLVLNTTSDIDVAPTVHTSYSVHYPAEINSNLNELCLTRSTEHHQCYWNPDSLLTGTYCSLCRPVCRSQSMTISLVRFCIGAVIIHISALIGWTTFVGIATDCTPKDSQRSLVGLLFVMYGIAWQITPLWCISVYDLFGKRTFAPLIVWSTTLFLCFVGLVALYKDLGPLKNSEMTKLGSKPQELGGPRMSDGQDQFLVENIDV